jgi:hypothetical protein
MTERADANLSAVEVRAITQLIIQATLGVTDVTQDAHRNFATVPGPLSRVVQPVLMAVPDVVYATIRGITRLVGGSLDAALALVPSDVAIAPSSGNTSEIKEAALAALNGVLGDTLAAQKNALAISMSLRRNGRSIAPQTLPIEQRELMIFVHGSCMNDLQWRQGERDYGAALEGSTGATALYLHYNSGLHISENGAQFSALLEAIPGAAHITFVTHSMGGLVVRSACEHAKRQNARWLSRVRAGVFLGTPHHGAPLERLGKLVDFGLDATSYTKAFSRLGKIRSAGVGDLADGRITEDASWTPLPSGPHWFAAAAMLSTVDGGAGPAGTAARLVGDGLVPLESALGVGTRGTLAIPAEHQWVGYNMNHIDLLRSEELLAKLKQWVPVR